MIRFRQALRLLFINAVLIRHGLDEIILTTPLLRPVRFLLYLLPWNWVRRTRAPRAVRLRRALEDLGPIFVKFGQIISTRRDLLPEDIADELANLQDRVPPFPGAQARAIVERALQSPVAELFAEFDEKPLASASIAQVHAARLKDGREVVVKVVRPGIEVVIRRDVGLLYLVAELAERYWREGRRLHPRQIVAEYETTILDELDLMREGASASQLRRNFMDSELLKVPEVYWEYSRPNVMVMERISGIPISDIKALKAHGVDLRALAERGVEIFFTQVMRHNFFHADMHPGNIFVSRDDPQNPRYVAVDFGIMGSLSPEDQHYLAENFIAFFNRDYHRVAELHVLSEWVPADTRINEFESAIRSVCEPIFQRPLKDISFGQLLLRLFQTARRFNMEVQPQLVLLQKTLLNIEGLGRQLYPDLDLWQTAKPFLEQWMAEQLGPRALMRELKSHAPRWAETLPALPGLAHEVLRQARSGKLRVELGPGEIDKIRREMRRSNQRTVLGVVGAGLMLAAVVLLAVEERSVEAATVPLLTWILGGLGMYMIIAALPWDSD
ncbi:MAG: ubiquinone biosynthesis regulatory protein kinase UbiB [Gammaproteobacteria bacterium]|nr:ubiquinone biosynthesis regulatory protein kinase UbiB [Gammaproteobacteria bacterium]NIM75040.1 ubiquinone biosynthesis regulatory protein kinase UbiB [Gammaproteobacteria bacterium]NIN40090.1 ubiquinone biosynthesis regulatory protein kinase UbiB [Gammaproteobacteria bacterium]NIO26577.1 ubiquinone biosynthesis regulatory protein kinase UbiB [Gammaproteobacteria bacterium]NIO67129.1 ubiquinone biosynthesis regulatory protein kinase UbiB [Gammaproteobacteria bacterium]